MNDNVAAFAELGRRRTSSSAHRADDSDIRDGPADLDAGAHLADRRAGGAPRRRGRRVARGGLARGLAYGLSSFASKPIEEVVAANPQTFFQIVLGRRARRHRRPHRARQDGGAVG